MRPDMRTRFGFWLERFAVLHGWLFIYDGITPSGFGRYVNRINGHLVMMTDDRKLITPGSRTVPPNRENGSQDA